jgi:hypothetical protein
MVETSILESATVFFAFVSDSSDGARSVVVQQSILSSSRHTNRRKTREQSHIFLRTPYKKRRKNKHNLLTICIKFNYLSVFFLMEHCNHHPRAEMNVFNINQIIVVGGKQIKAFFVWNFKKENDAFWTLNARKEVIDGIF